MNLESDFDTLNEVALRGAQLLRDFLLAGPEQDTLLTLASLSLAVDSLNTPDAIYDFGVVKCLLGYG